MKAESRRVSASSTGAAKHAKKKSDSCATLYRRRNWTESEDEALTSQVARLGSNDWKAVAARMCGRNAKQCYQRWFYSLKPATSMRPWSHDEDKTILKLQKDLGNKWVQIASMLNNRSGYAVKNRYRRITKSRPSKKAPKVAAIKPKAARKATLQRPVRSTTMAAARRSRMHDHQNSDSSISTESEWDTDGETNSDCTDKPAFRESKTQGAW